MVTLHAAAVSAFGVQARYPAGREVRCRSRTPGCREVCRWPVRQSALARISLPRALGCSLSSGSEGSVLRSPGLPTAMLGACSCRRSPRLLRRISTADAACAPRSRRRSYPRKARQFANRSVLDDGHAIWRNTISEAATLQLSAVALRAACVTAVQSVDDHEFNVARAASRVRTPSARFARLLRPTRVAIGGPLEAVMLA